jgi:hypothetical protein
VARRVAPVVGLALMALMVPSVGAKAAPPRTTAALGPIRILKAADSVDPDGRAVTAPSVRPAIPGPMVTLGGPILESPRIYLVFWGWKGHDDDGVRARLIDFFNGVGGSGWVGVTTQYDGTVDGSHVQITNPGSQLAGVWDDTSSIHDNLEDGELAYEAIRAAAHFNGGVADINANYMIATPQRANAAGFNDTTSYYCAWHSSTYAGNKPISFTNLPYLLNKGHSCGQNAVNAGADGFLDGITIAAGHEYLESITDPDVSSGWRDAAQQENGDKCAWVTVGAGKMTNYDFSTGTFPVQGSWSNSVFPAGDCATG